MEQTLHPVSQTSDKNELLAAIDEAASSLQGLMASLDDNQVNAVPYPDSWTAGQLFRHVAKSTGGMAKAMKAMGKPSARDAAERIPELKKTFLDFATKLKSPDFIVPEKGPYDRASITGELSGSFKKLNESAAGANLTELIEGLPLGPISKLEMLHFVLYHTQRHLHQMKKICDALKS